MATVIAESLLHFIWQGTALGALAFVVLRRIGDHPAARYAIGLGTLAAMALAPVLTAVWILSADVAPVVGLPFPVATAGNTLPVAWVLGLWASGVTVCTVRLTGGWILARRMATKAAAPVSREIEAMASRVAARLAVSTPYAVLESAIAASPMMIGWLKPVILLPSAAIAGLPPSQLEALIAHELGHIRRHDYIVNLLQSVVEALLFFHPAVWLISREVREAREQCCDDLTVSVCDRLVYVSALSSVAGLRAASPALAAGGGSLRRRVQRILHPQPAAPSFVAWLAAAPIALVLAAAMPVTGVPGPAATPRVTSAAAALEAAPQTTPTPSVNGSAPPEVRASIPPTPGALLTPDSKSVRVSTPRTELTAVVRPALPVVINYLITPTQAMELQAPPPPAAPPRRLAVDDIVRLTWTNVAERDLDLNRHYVVGADGTIAVKYLGAVQVVGKTTAEVETSLVGGMTDKQIYLRGVISVAAEMAHDDRRNIIIQGLVARPGAKRLFPDEMTVLKAIAAAGGIQPAAGDIEIRRRGVDQAINITQTQFRAGADLGLVDGDMVTVRQSFVFFVNGHVNSPGMKVWEPGMTVLKALALAGGLTLKGKYGHIERPIKDEKGKILRYEKIKNLGDETEIRPDDVLIIAGKWFGL